MTSISTSPVAPNQSVQMQNNVSAMDKVPQEKLYLPGKYTIPSDLLSSSPKYEEKKSGGFFSFLGKLVFTTAFLGVAAGLLRKYPLKNVDINSETTGLLNNIKRSTAKLGENINTNVFAKIKGWFKDVTKEKPKTEPKASEDKK